MRLRAGPEGSAGPRDVLAALGLADLEHRRRPPDAHRRGARAMTPAASAGRLLPHANACSPVLPNKKART